MTQKQRRVCMSVTLLHTPVLQRLHKDISRLITFWARKELTYHVYDWQFVQSVCACWIWWIAHLRTESHTADGVKPSERVVDFERRGNLHFGGNCANTGKATHCPSAPRLDQHTCFRCNGSSQLGRIYGIALWCLCLHDHWGGARQLDNVLRSFQRGMSSVPTRQNVFGWKSKFGDFDSA